MELINGIKERRSIRKYTDKKVDPELVMEIISAAIYAPSWKNSQTSRYTLITDEKLKNRIAVEATCGFAKNSGVIQSAPALIVLSTVNGVSGYNLDGSFTTDKGEHWQSFDAGIAAEAFCLAAYAKGLGTLIMGIYDEGMVKELVNIPENEGVSALIALGYYDAEVKAPNRKTVGEITRIL